MISKKTKIGLPLLMCSGLLLSACDFGVLVPDLGNSSAESGSTASTASSSASSSGSAAVVSLPAGNTSSSGSSQANSGTTPPVPGNVAVNRTINLNWVASPSGDVKGYYVYHGTVPDNYQDRVWVGLSTRHDFAISQSDDHFFAVTALNQSNVESGFSSEAGVTVIP